MISFDSSLKAPLWSAVARNNAHFDKSESSLTIMRADRSKPLAGVSGSKCDIRSSSPIDNWRPFERLRLPRCGDYLFRSLSFSTTVDCFVGMPLPRATAAAYLVWNCDSGCSLMGQWVNATYGFSPGRNGEGLPRFTA